LISVELLEQAEKFKFIELLCALVLIFDFTFMDLEQFILLNLAFKSIIFVNEFLTDLCIFLIANQTFSIAITAPKHNLDLEWSQLNLLASLQGLVTLNNSDLSAAIVILFSEFLPDEHCDIVHVVVHHLADGYFISYIIKHIGEFLVLDGFTFLESY
jgi:hypothetical protein